MLQDLYRLREWLKAKQCQAVAMESTGVYWKPIWNVLEGEVELLLCNAQHIKAVPGRKTERAGRRMDRRLTPTREAREPALCLPAPNGNCGT
jgi:transposase